MAIALIAAAAILDGLDGRVARALDAESRMGEEIDSLADAVNFGVAPAVVMYVSMMPGKPAGWVVVMLYAVSIVLRLARFNALLDDASQPPFAREFFVGVPAPAGAIMRARSAGRQVAVRRRLVDVAVVRLRVADGVLDAAGQPDPDAQDARRLGAAEPGRAAAGRADHRRRGRVPVPLHPDHGDDRGVPLLHPVLGPQPPLAGRASRGVGRETQAAARDPPRDPPGTAQPNRRSMARLGLRRPTGRP